MDKHVSMTQTRKAQPRRLFWQAASILVSVGLMAYILLQMDMTHFMEMVRTVPAWSIIGAFIIYIALNYFRALRFRSFMPRPHPTVVDLLPIVLYHNFLTRVLPFKTGEISYVILVNRHLKQPISEGISSLLSARLFELGLVILGGAFGVLSMNSQPTEQRILWFVLLLVVLVVYAIALYHSGAILRLLARWWMRVAGGRAPKFAAKVEDKLHTFATQFDRMHEKRVLISACVLSFCTYTMSMSFDLILMRGLGLEQPLGVLMTIISIRMFLEAAPIAVSGFGVVEGSFAFGLVTLAGMPLDEAASIGLFLHISQIVIAGLTGLIGYLLLNQLKNRKPASAEVPAS
jgi:uncharacterized protein (TIRG00374 family)